MPSLYQWRMFLKMWPPAASLLGQGDVAVSTVDQISKINTDTADPLNLLMNNSNNYDTEFDYKQ